MFLKIKNKISELIQKHGWKAAVVIFMFYLGKGLLWLIIPWMIAKHTL